MKLAAGPTPSPDDWQLDVDDNDDMGVYRPVDEPLIRLRLGAHSFDGERTAYASLFHDEERFWLQCYGTATQRILEYAGESGPGVPYGSFVMRRGDVDDGRVVGLHCHGGRQGFQVRADEVFTPEETIDAFLSVFIAQELPESWRLVEQPSRTSDPLFPSRSQKILAPCPSPAGEPFVAAFPAAPSNVVPGSWAVEVDGCRYAVSASEHEDLYEARRALDAMMPPDAIGSWHTPQPGVRGAYYVKDARSVVRHGHSFRGWAIIAEVSGPPDRLEVSVGRAFLDSVKPAG